MLEPEKTGENRDEKGRFISGVSGNPTGRPHGSFSITDQVRQLLQEIPAGERKTYLEFLIMQIIRKALKGDNQTIKLIWNYIDGMPPQKTDITFEEKSLLTEGQIDRLILGIMQRNERFRPWLENKEFLALLDL